MSETSGQLPPPSDVAVALASHPSTELVVTGGRTLIEMDYQAFLAILGTTDAVLAAAVLASASAQQDHTS